ncbi:MAG: ATP-dependent helicase, partial [Sphingomonadales bacterium]|nr:ATP-dependent helicase [Sphingomonadales bacterium]
MILLNAPLVGQRLGYPELSGLDLLELFAFVHPARFMVPTVKGLAETLGLAVPVDEGASAAFFRMADAAFISRMLWVWPERDGAWTSGQTLSRILWTWVPIVLM